MLFLSLGNRQYCATQDELYADVDINDQTEESVDRQVAITSIHTCFVLIVTQLLVRELSIKMTSIRTQKPEVICKVSCICPLSHGHVAGNSFVVAEWSVWIFFTSLWRSKYYVPLPPPPEFKSYIYHYNIWNASCHNSTEEFFFKFMTSRQDCYLSYSCHS